jgi:1-acyl-sn-glycerol-3-phosphate acyltransferase
MDIPVVGWAMNLAKHVFLKRDDLKSTLEVTDTCVQRVSK